MSEYSNPIFERANTLAPPSPPNPPTTAPEYKKRPFSS